MTLVLDQLAAPPLSSAEAAPLVALARACRSAARTLSLYPPEHPNIGTALAAVTGAARQATAGGPVHLTVLPDSLQAGGRSFVRPDPAITDLANLLHRHFVAVLTIAPGASDDAWRRFVTLLGVQPDQARIRGGIVKLWASEGEQAITLKQLDYRELLRDAIRGETATWEAIVNHCLAGESLVLDEWMVDLLLDVLNEPARAAELAAAVEARLTDGRGRGPLAVGSLLQAVSQFVAKVQPQRLESVLNGMAEAVATLPMGTLSGLMAARGMADRPSLASFVENIAVRMKDAAVAGAIVTEVRENRGTSPDVAAALWGVAPDIDRREAILTLARQMLHESGALEDSAGEQMWRQTEQLLTNYDHTSYVGTAYTTELNRASDRAVDLDQAKTDPPERLAGWASSVSDDAVRGLDALLLVDLLGLRSDPAEWRELADLVVARIQVSIVLGDFTTASGLAEAITASADHHDDADLRAVAASARDRVLDGVAMRHMASHLDTSEPTLVADVERLCRAVGTGAISPLAQALAREERTRSRQNLVTLLVSFGASGRQAVEKLMQSENAAVRRTAVVLLREFGGRDALPELESLLRDRAPHVQREATRAIAHLGIDEAFQILARALSGGTDESRAVIMNALWSVPSSDAAPALAFVLRHTPPTGSMRDVHEKAIQRLGEVDSREAVEGLEHALHRGSLFTPFATAALRRQSAASLARIGSSRAIDVLKSAAATGSRGVRAAARGALRERSASGRVVEAAR